MLDPVTGKFTVYKNKPGDSTSISDDRIYGIGEDIQENLWVGTLGSGLNRLNRKTGDFDRINSTNSGICNDYITSIYRDKEKNLWITTTLGLSRYDKNLKSFTCQQNRPGDLKSIIDNEVTTSLEDSRGFFWVGTNNGIKF